MPSRHVLGEGGYKTADGDHVVAVGAGRDPEDGVGSGDELGAGPETRTESDDREGSPFVRESQCSVSARLL